MRYKPAPVVRIPPVIFVIITSITTHCLKTRRRRNSFQPAKNRGLALAAQLVFHQGEIWPIGANTLDNAASTILANNHIDLSGSTFNNQSWQSGTLTDYLVYTYPREILTSEICRK